MLVKKHNLLKINKINKKKTYNSDKAYNTQLI